MSDLESELKELCSTVAGVDQFSIKPFVDGCYFLFHQFHVHSENPSLVALQNSQSTTKTVENTRLYHNFVLQLHKA